MNILMPYISCVVIWGSTWLAIKYQLGQVDPMISVGHRFLLAAVMLFVFSLFSKKALKFTLKEHLCFLQQGILLFGINYWLFYVGEQYLTSGLVAVIFSLIVVFNMLLSVFLLNTPITANMAYGAGLGLFGMMILFYPELAMYSFDAAKTKGLLICLLATFIASFGNIRAAKNSKLGLPIVQGNAYSMLYGSILMYGLGVLSGSKIIVPMTASYLGSLVYLAIFGSVIAFGLYLGLLAKIGPGKASYMTLLFPIVALSISVIFEGQKWSPYTTLGLFLILIGNYFILVSKESKTAVIQRLFRRRPIKQEQAS